MMGERSRSPRVLLLSANPNLPTFVSPYGLEVVGAALRRELDAEVRIVDPFLKEPIRPWLPAILGRFCPDVVGIGFRNLDLIFTADKEQQAVVGRSCLPDLESVVQTVLATGFARERILLGGSGFSIAPRAILRRFGLPYGIAGPGARACVAFVRAVARGAEPGEIPGLVTSDAAARFTPDEPSFDVEIVPLESSGHRRILAKNNLPFPLRTSSGCGLRCSYCVEGGIQGRPARARSIESIEQELRWIVEQGGKRLIFADGELNAPCLSGRERLLELVSETGLSWRAYFLAVPPSEEQLSLMRASRCEGVLLTVDTGAETVLDGIGRPGTVAEMSDALDRYRSAGLPTEATLICGLPGETFSSIDDTVALVRAHPEVKFNYACGVRVYPNTSLAEHVEEHAWANVYGYGRADPLQISIYSEPEPPWRIREYLDAAFAECGNAAPYLGGEGRLDRLAELISSPGANGSSP